MGVLRLAIVLTVAAGLGGQEAPQDDRLYGRVTTSAGDVVEGYLRWDRNEGSWGDLLNGDKEIPWENYRDAERLDRDYRDRRDRERSIRFLGIRITWDDDEDGPTQATSGIRFGHLASLEVRSDRGASLVLKSGQEIELEGGSTDLGRSLRRLVVAKPGGGEVDLRWRDIEFVDFLQAPSGVARARDERLFGTLRTWSGDEFTGWVAWDVDEIFTTDVLDGEERGRKREIEFGRIHSIERAGGSGARVVLKNREELTLRGSNDVDDGNRGVAVSDPGLGQVQVDWDDFESVTFHQPPATGLGYDTFDGGLELYGRVETERGASYEGYIRWDNDEAFSWEMLDGRDGGVDFDVEFGAISQIDKNGGWGVDVTLRDGRVLRLEGSNDVDDGNKGVFIRLEDGEMVMVHWDDFARLTLAHG